MEDEAKSILFVFLGIGLAVSLVIATVYVPYAITTRWYIEHGYSTCVFPGHAGVEWCVPTPAPQGTNDGCICDTH